MSINDLIAQGIKPIEIPDPVNMLTKFMQLQSMQREAEMFDMKKQQLQQDVTNSATRNKLLDSLWTNDGSDPRPYNSLLQGSMSGNVGPTVQNAARMDAMPAPQPGQPRMNLNTLARLAASGMKTDDLLNIFKYQNDGVKRDVNAYYQDPTTGETRYFADPTKGMDFDPKTRTVTPLAGFSQTNAAIKGAETNAIEGAKANYDLLPLNYADQNGRPIGGSKGQYLAGVGQPQTPAQAGPQFDFQGADLLAQIPPQDRQKILQSAMRDGSHQFTLNYRLPNGQMVQGQVDLSTGSMPKFIQEKVDYIRSKATPDERKQFIDNFMQSLSLVNDPEERIKRMHAFYSQLQEPAGTPIRGYEAGKQNGNSMPALQSEAEREAQVGRVKTLNSVDEARMKSDQERMTKDSRLYQQLTAAIPMARDLLKNATGSGAGALADQTMAFFGKSTKGAQAAQALDTIGGWMTANVPRMEGPQSNIDVLNYQTMAARVADRTQPTQARLAALDVLEQLQKKYAQVNGVATGNASGADMSTAPSNAARSIPDGAIKMLKSNPSLRADFEAKYGAGSAASILGK